MTVATLDLILFISCLVTLPIYLILLMTMYKFRHKSPLNSAFFEIAFNLGILDMAHLLTDWGLGKFANFGWLGVHKMVMLYPSAFAKLNSLCWWYIGLAQTLGVASMAINRMCVIGFRIVSLFIYWLTCRYYWLIGCLELVVESAERKFDYYMAVSCANNSTPTVSWL